MWIHDDCDASSSCFHHHVSYDTKKSITVCRSPFAFSGFSFYRYIVVLGSESSSLSFKTHSVLKATVLKGMSHQRQNDTRKIPRKGVNVRAIVALTMAMGWSASSAYQFQSTTFLTGKITCNIGNAVTGRIRHTGMRRHARNSDSEEAAFLSSFLYEGTFQGMNDGILAYLPDGGKSLPPRMRRLVERVTFDYIHGINNRQSQVDLPDLLDVVDSEYESLSPSISFMVGNQTFADPQIVQIVSLAVLHQLPKEITLQLTSTSESQGMAKFRSNFDNVGWEQVSFPQGLGIRLKKKLQYSPIQPFSPPSKLPWRTRSKRKAALAARRGILKAAETRAPAQKTMLKKEELLAEFENEMQAAPISGLPPDGQIGNSEGGPRMQDVALPSFPVERYGKAWTKVKRAFFNPAGPTGIISNSRLAKKIFSTMDTQYTRMKQAGRAGILSYAFINFVLYTAGVVWQYRRIVVEVSDGSTLPSLILRKFAKAFARVYAGAAVFKFFRILLALALAPAGGRVLDVTQRKLRVSENTAFVILLTLLLQSFLVTLTVVCLGDSAIRTTIPIPSPRGLQPC